MPSKYPSTPHLPFSPQVNSDDIKLSFGDCSQFTNREVIITEKLDGGNCQLNQRKVYARTTSKEATHPSFGPIKSLFAEFSYLVPDNIVLVGENMVGIHSIEYTQLKSYFYLFAVLNKDEDRWLSWDHIQELAEEYEIPTVPVLKRGIFNSMDEIKKFMNETMSQGESSLGGPIEGFVIRVVDSFSSKQFERNIAKYVRQGHIQTDQTWRRTWRQAKLIS
eukprot:gb/GECH01008630.1/.p1 GENE.gb/GECH01008630.1/~~gb/GECH01008630.1/.p1  ORF type:complete len:220 (+),score=45.72 gb/GECH01008630.1/:1-660(+)